MKKYAKYLIIPLILISSAVYAQNIDEEVRQSLGRLLERKSAENQPPIEEIIQYNGKLVNNGTERFLSKSDFVTLENMRHYREGIGTRSGMNGYTTDSEPNANQIASIIPFNNENVYYLLGASTDGSGNTYFQIEDNAFGSTALYHSSGASTTKITYATVRDTLFIGDAGGVTAWAGVSTYPLFLLVEESDGIYTDYANWIHSGTSESVSSGNTVHVGYSRPFDKWMADENEDSMDDMASAVTETFKGGKSAFWLSYTCTTGGSKFQNPKIYTNPRELGTQWDGRSYQYPQAALVKISGNSEYQEYTLFVQDESDETYMDISEMETSGYIDLGFLYVPRQIRITLPEDFKNDQASGISAYYWNGAWSLAANFTDGTSSSSIAFKQSGILEFDRPTDIKTRKLGQVPFDLYPIRIQTDAELSNYLRISSVKAVPDYDSPSSTAKYTMVASLYDRLGLANGRDLTKILISAKNQPDTFIGPDACDEEDNPLIVGKREKTIWFGQVGPYIMFMKKTENYTTYGTNPDTFIADLSPLLGTSPCIATDSVAVIERDGATFLAYLSKEGPRLISPTGENPPIFEDVRDYFTPGTDLAFSDTQMTNAIGWYNRLFDEYHLLIGGKELVYNMKLDRKPWTVFKRNSAVQISYGTIVTDNDNQRYELLGGAGGTVYQAETGISDYGYDIISGATKPPIALNGRVNMKSDLDSFKLKYDLPGGSSIAGCTLFMTPGIASGQTNYATDLQDNLDSDLDTEGAAWVNMNNFRGNTKGFYHQFGIEVPGRIFIDQAIVGSRGEGWRH